MNARAKTYQVLYDVYKGFQLPHSLSDAFSGANGDTEIISLYNSNYLTFQLATFNTNRTTEEAYKAVRAACLKGYPWFS